MVAALDFFDVLGVPDASISGHFISLVHYLKELFVSLLKLLILLSKFLFQLGPLLIKLNLLIFQVLLGLPVQFFVPFYLFSTLFQLLLHFDQL